jgi:hypothetical protein
MDYEAWGCSSFLWFLSECLKAGVGDKRAISRTMTDLVKMLQKKQKPGGGWSYYLSTSVGKGVPADQRSISFTTALVTYSLIKAKKASIAIPNNVLAAAIDCLAKMRNHNGSFTYFYNHNNRGANSTGIPGSAGRVPLCELVLHHAKRGSLERIRQGLDIFMRYRHELSRQRGKALMHTGRHGQGSHYLMFDYAFAAAAIKELPEKERDKYRDTLLEIVLNARTEEGSFLDSPLLGHCYGTAMALLTFQYLK